MLPQQPFGSQQLRPILAKKEEKDAEVKEAKWETTRAYKLLEGRKRVKFDG
jgi:hypothetical protein